MLRVLVLAAGLLTAGPAQAATIDEGPIPDFGRLIQGCCLNAEGTLGKPAETISLCFADGAADTALLDEAGHRLESQSGRYSVRNEQLVLSGPPDVAWVFGRPTLICDVGVKPYVRLALFDCVGSGDGEPAVFFDDLVFMAMREAAT
jgi:hypothetical protein